MEKNNNWDTKEINLTDSFKELFTEYDINYKNLKEDILKQDSQDFWKKFLKLLINIANEK